MIDFAKYGVRSIRANTDPVSREKNIKLHSSRKLTKYNSNFNNNYKQARKFERELLEKLKNK